MAKMVTIRHRLGVLAVAFILASLCSALLSDEAEAYCSGKGSICVASDNLERSCDEKSGLDYYECLCESGWMGTKQACADCENSLGGVGFGAGDFYSSICSEESFTIAPVPSSILSSQSARNKTVAVPTVTLSSSTSSSRIATATTTPNYKDPYTTRIDGMTPVTLPPMATRTDAPSGASSMRKRPLVAVACLAFLAFALF